MTVLSPELTPVRTARMPVRGSDVIVLDDGGMLVHSVEHDPATFGLPLHYVSHVGKRGPSFGNTDMTVLPDSEGSLRRILARASATSVWAARPDRYVLQEWLNDGSLRRTISRNPPWFDASGVDNTRRDRQRPGTTLRAIQVDNLGRIWVLATLPRVDWRPTPPATTGDKSVPPGDLSLYLDSMVEILDGRTGVLIASARFRSAFFGFAGPGVVASRRRISARIEAIDLWRLQVTTPN